MVHRSLTAITILAAFSIVCLGVTTGLIWMLDRPLSTTATRALSRIEISHGMTARQIGRALEDAGVIRSAAFFEVSARYRNLTRGLEAGTYELGSDQSTGQVLETLRRAPLQLERITVPEGLTRTQIAGLLQRAGAVDSARFVSLTESKELIKRLGLSERHLEGYLFPETYLIAKNASEEEIIERMVGEFFEVFTDSLYTRLDAVGLSLHEAITLASMVEREAVVQKERPIISSVFHRRLKLKRRLESCATVEFALGVHKKRLTNADLKVESPYNTYRHSGLPPGPIGSPGRASILAALYPSETEYLYFVARGDGTHSFTRTNREHNAEKRAIRLRQRRQARLK
jgi:UPF0755 protein